MKFATLLTPSSIYMSRTPIFKYTTLGPMIPKEKKYNLCSKGGNSKSRLTRDGFYILHIVSWCFTFVRNFIIISRKVFNLQSGHEYMVEMTMFNVQRAITPKVGKPELWFICSACCLIVPYICVKSRENISDGIRVMEWTQMMEVLTD